MARAGVRVIAGAARGRRLVVPAGARPTADRVREAVFSALGDVDDASVLDLYAGSGALAIEALSRGATRALLVDRDRSAAEACHDNLETAGVADRGRVERSDALAMLRRRPPAEAPFDLVLVDPPYEATADGVAGVLDALGRPGWLAGGARVVVERPVREAPVAVPSSWEVAWERRYGDTLVVVLREQD